MAESEEELNSLLMKVKVESEKVGLKLNIKETKIMASGPITSWEIDGETVEKQCQNLFFGAPKSLQMVTAAMKLKDATLLGRKVMTNLPHHSQVFCISKQKVCLSHLLKQLSPPGQEGGAI